MRNLTLKFSLIAFMFGSLVSDVHAQSIITSLTPERPKAPVAMKQNSQTIYKKMVDILGAKDVNVLTTPNQVIVFSSKEQGALSFGADQKMKIHDAGKVERMVALSGGKTTHLPSALGHKISTNQKATKRFTDTLGALAPIALKSGGIELNFRANKIGFKPVRFKNSKRPLILKTPTGRVMIQANGATRARFATPLATQPKRVGFRVK